MKTRIRMLDKVKFAEISLCDHPANENSSITRIQSIPIIKRKETLNMSRPFADFYEAHRALRKTTVFPVPGRALDPYSVPTVNRTDELGTITNDQARSESANPNADADVVRRQLREVMTVGGNGDWRKVVGLIQGSMRPTVISVRPNDGVTRMPSGPSGNAKPNDFDVRGHYRQPSGNADGDIDPSFMRPA